MEKKTKEMIKTAVMLNYRDVALREDLSLNSQTSCCNNLTSISESLGYSSEEYENVPEGANMGIGCGNPQAIASLKKGEVVLDLGSGAGFDCFLAAKSVGETGKVIGIDMTIEMVLKARNNAKKGAYVNTEFKLGEIEQLPIPDATVDVIISNCVINLSPQKEKVFKEAYRVLKPGGRLAISDIVATAEFPEELKNDISMICGCMTGASSLKKLKFLIYKAGFTDVKITSNSKSRDFIKDWRPESGIENFIVSATIEAFKKK
ncbi:MAG: arsenite S-adenosylmethyltransferase [Flavobacteriaceae bacterium]|nr:MAG: arsenite S-adenosylmethyltransferase [Flavobacteriaceae bacterium]